MESTKYFDVLDEDKPISGQKFTCISFISPEKILKLKPVTEVHNFVLCTMSPKLKNFVKKL